MLLRSRHGDRSGTEADRCCTSLRRIFLDGVGAPLIKI